MAINHIIIGPRREPLFEFENEDILSCVVNNTVDPIGNQLPINTAETEIQSSGTVVNFCPSDYPDGMQSSDGIVIYCRNQDYGIDTLPHATEIHIDVDGNNVGFYYLDKVQQVGPSRWHIDAFNYVGLLDEYYSHPTYSFDGKTINEFLMMNMSNLQILNRFVRTEIGNRPVPNSGFVTRKIAREAIQEILFANGVTLVETDNDKIEVREIIKQSTGDISADLTFDNGTVEYPSPVHSITVSEYLFSKDVSTREELLWDNSDPESGAVAGHIFYLDGLPVYTYRSDGNLTVTAYWQGEYSFFILSGKGRLFGQRITATKVNKTVVNPDQSTGEDISVDSYTITPLNSDAILRRLAAYYFAPRVTFQTDIVWNGEAPGSRYDVPTPYKTVESGTLTNAQITLSRTPRAACTFESRWEPVSAAAYSNSVILTGSGVWEVPAGVDSIRVALIGGGSGGYSGTKGKDGTNTVQRYAAGVIASSGGEKGNPGTPGKVFVTTIQNPSGAYAYSCGDGGVGGSASSSTSKHNAGLDGGDTTFGQFTSAVGASSADGYKDLITGRIYAANFNDTFWGSTDSGKANITETTWAVDAPWYSYPKYSNGVQTLPTVEGYTPYGHTKFTLNDGVYFSTLHGFPGGCTANKVGAQGKKSTKGTDNKVHLGNGGNGATPTEKGTYPLDINKSYYGYGGGGGHGGGGGGMAGFHYYSDSWVNDYVVAGKGGLGGNGGPGGDGAPGCIIIYY